MEYIIYGKCSQIKNPTWKKGPSVFFTFLHTCHICHTCHVSHSHTCHEFFAFFSLEQIFKKKWHKIGINAKRFWTKSDSSQKFISQKKITWSTIEPCVSHFSQWEKNVQKNQKNHVATFSDSEPLAWRKISKNFKKFQLKKFGMEKKPEFLLKKSPRERGEFCFYFRFYIRNLWLFYKFTKFDKFMIIFEFIANSFILLVFYQKFKKWIFRI